MTTGKLIKPAGLALGFAVLLATTHSATKHVIAENQREYEQRVLRELAGGAEIEPAEKGFLIVSEGETIGHINNASTLAGYNGLIEMLIAADNAGKILGVRITQHQETPGLGDKIDHRVSDWISQFKGRSLQNTKWSLQPDGDIDSITGATITARATLNAVRESLEP